MTTPSLTGVFWIFRRAGGQAVDGLLGWLALAPFIRQQIFAFVTIVYY